jgi:carbon monoxide dehydrogenase subunit G
MRPGRGRRACRHKVRNGYWPQPSIATKTARAVAAGLGRIEVAGAMKISGEIIVPARQVEVFDRLKDAPFFASCVEGVRALKAIDATHYDALFETKVAYLNFRFRVSVEVTRMSPPDLIETKIEGVPLGIVGRLTATATTRLHQSNGATLLVYTINASLTGKLGSIGQPVLAAKANAMQKMFTDRLLAAFMASARTAQ